MRKLLLTGAVALFSFLGRTQFTHTDAIYYVGEGPDTAILVVDFLDETSDSCYAWGYLFDASATVTGGDMLEAIAADEETFSIETGGGFLNDIFYNQHVGEAGDPNYWGTWSRTDETEWESNIGLGTELANGDWFGCSYTDFDPAVAPGEPLAAYASSKFSEDDVQFWVGTGENSAVFVVDFVEATYGEAVSYAWGYRFDGSTDGAAMLADIDEADVNLDIDAGDFLNDILFNGLAGIAGDPNYWGTWSGTNLSDWTMNAGLSTEINDGDWFGCSYEAWPPRRPFYPIAALDSAAFVSDDADFLVGSGENKVVIVIDFNEWAPGQSYAIGYSFDTETVTAEQVLTDLNESPYYTLDIDLGGGFLNTIEYASEGLTGEGGAPYYWSTWSANNVGGWELNGGISEEMSDGDWFACTYSSWSPATPPSIPSVATSAAGIEEIETTQLSLYPNPTNSNLNIVLESGADVQIIDINGRVVWYATQLQGTSTVDVSGLESGVYFVNATIGAETVVQKLIIQ